MTCSTLPASIRLGLLAAALAAVLPVAQAQTGRAKGTPISCSIRGIHLLGGIGSAAELEI